MDVNAVTRRIADTLSRDAAISREKVSVVWGAAPSADYGDSFPLMRVTKGRAPVVRRQMGTGADPDRHPPVEVWLDAEVAVVTDVAATAGDAEAEAWRLAGLAEAALARNAMLADAEGQDRLVHSLELKSVRTLPRLVGRERCGVTVAVMAKAIEDPGAPVLNSGEGGG